MDLNFKQLEQDITKNREDITKKLVGFARADALLFWSPEDDLRKEQEQKWMPVIHWADNLINARFKVTTSLEVENAGVETASELKNFMDKLSAKELTAFYLAALNTRSVLLATALVKGHINADEAFELSELEELYQARKWGKEEVAEARRKSIKDTLNSIEKYLAK